MDGPVKVWKLKAEDLIKRWQETGPQANLMLAQLKQHNLEELLSLRPGNLERLIATREVWQIKAFADLETSIAVGSNIIEKATPHFTRADRLYSAALALQDEKLIRKDYVEMLRRWAELYRSNDRINEAAKLENRATNLEMEGIRLD
jgi:hypothetical protein